MPPQRDESKLPKWAQHELRRLRMRVEEAAERDAVGPVNSNTFADPHAEHLEGVSPRPLGKDTHIRFWLNREKGWYIDARLEFGELRVSGSDGLLVLPRATNLLGVALERSWQT